MIDFPHHRTLTSIYETIKIEADHKWKARLLKKSSIEDALIDHNAALDDAARSFQVSFIQCNVHH